MHSASGVHVLTVGCTFFGTCAPGECVHKIMLIFETGFSWRLENENGHGKVMEHEKLTKSHGIL